MKCILRYMKACLKAIIVAVIIKFSGTFLEFLIPYVLEHLLDDIAPKKDLREVLIWGAIMIAIALIVRALNITANRMAVGVARDCIYRIRGDLFKKTLHLSGNQVDKYGLPSLTSRMTSDSYNVQNFIRMMQTMGVRAPILLLGGMIVTLTMDAGLASVLLVLVPILIVSVILISKKGIPLYVNVQQAVDTIVRVMRENITGIRVVKALSKEQKETKRYAQANDDMFKKDTHASIVMSLPGPLTTLFLNVGLTLVVVLGAYRVNGGVTKPGVILAFLTYFNMILNGVGGINRIFIMYSKANASANRISLVLDEGVPFETVYGEDTSDKFIAFENVNFGYMKQAGEQCSPLQEDDVERHALAQDYELEGINFSMEKGSSLGIIGPTGSGKTTIINLLMRFYDATEGKVIIDGKDVREYDLQELRRRFGVVFQNDVIFADTLFENICFGRDVDRKRAMAAASDAQAYNFISAYDDKLDHKAEIHGANLSGGQKQRVLITRALAAHPEILILDDSSSALDYKTDALLRQTIRANYKDTTTIIVAQRISSVMSLDNIIVLDDGKIVGQGTHDYLMENCDLYKEIYDVQMS